MFIEKHLKQTAVVWKAPIEDGFGGYTYPEPIEIKCRWEKKRISFETDAKEEEYSNAIIYSVVSLAVGDFAYLGNLIDLSTEQKADPTIVPFCYEIKTNDYSEDLRAFSKLYKSIL